MGKVEKKKTNRGRKPIEYSKEDLERQPMIMLICGMMGVGKSYRNRQEFTKYLSDHPETGKKGRKILAFDTNDDDFSDWKTVSPDHIKALTNVSTRRIRPWNKDGSAMDDDQKREVVDKIMRHYKNGLIVLDDIDNYMVGSKSQSMIGAMVTVRHKGVDVILGHQSIAKITTTEWQTCTWLRLHHQVDDVTRYKERIPKYRLVRIAQHIVDEQYDLAVSAYKTNRIDKNEFLKRKSFFLYINMPEQKIVGCSRAAFIRAAKKYIDQEENRLVKMMLLERTFKDEPIYQSRNEAVIKLIEDYLRFHDDKGLSPF
ncbi:MAG: zonular occludens toxin domain-containing protein [Ekhidna sp.]